VLGLCCGVDEKGLVQYWVQRRSARMLNWTAIGREAGSVARSWWLRIQVNLTGHGRDLRLVRMDSCKSASLPLG
jgi:hypothetical protein